MNRRGFLKSTVALAALAAVPLDALTPRTTDVWRHCAFTRKAGVYTWFVNGVAVEGESSAQLQLKNEHVNADVTTSECWYHPEHGYIRGGTHVRT